MEKNLANEFVSEKSSPEKTSNGEMIVFKN
jgi:hypothetical protein